MSNKKYTKAGFDKAVAAATRRFETGGAHLGTVRNWIQWNFQNGGTVKWGSQEYLTGTFITVREMEQLSEKIMKAVVKEFTSAFWHELKWQNELEKTKNEE